MRWEDVSTGGFWKKVILSHLDVVGVTLALQRSDGFEGSRNDSKAKSRAT